MGSLTTMARLNESIQCWIEAEGWTQLRPFQVEAINTIFDSSDDVLIMAPTASGKTEAALLPLISTCIERPAPGVRLLYIIPLKALANDLDRRLEELSGRVDMKVHRWHGDVAYSRKRKLLDDPNGLLILTPESLEAIFMNRPHRLGELFDGLEAVIIDEVHSYLGTERGAQLQSLLGRLDAIINRRVRRIGLSATVGDVSQTSDFIRRGGRVSVIRGGEHRIVDVTIQTFDPQLGDFPSNISGEILRATNQNSAVFCNSRATVEFWAARLSDHADNRLVVAHHGSLSKGHREFVETGLRSGDRPMTVVATSTLELGIDIGSLDHVGQIGPPPSVAALHQRAGRAGRRGTLSRTDIFVVSPTPEAESTAEDFLQADVVQALASVELQRMGWCETSPASPLHLSTLVQQILSVITQLGGSTDDQVFELLRRGGAFAAVTRELFNRLIIDLIETKVLRRPSDEPHFLRVGDEGESLTSHYRFFAAFSSPLEYRVMSPDGCLGTIVPYKTLRSGELLLFAGRRWRVESVSPSARLVEVSRSGGGRPPTFPGAAIPVATEVVRKMLELYERDDVPPFGDPLTCHRLWEAREHFRASGLRDRRIFGTSTGAVIYPWIGTHALTTLQLCLTGMGLATQASRLTLEVKCESEVELLDALQNIGSTPPTTEEIVRRLTDVSNFEKHHRYLSRELVALDYLSQCIDIEAAAKAARELCELHSKHDPSGYRHISGADLSIGRANESEGVHA